MEEILASIRRIIADDRMLPLTQRPASASAPAPENQQPVFEQAGPAPVSERRIDQQIDRAAESPALRLVPGGVAAEPDEPRAPTVREAEINEEDEDIRAFARSLSSKQETQDSTSAPEAVEDEVDIQPEPLVSASTDKSVASSFQSLAATVFMQNTSFIEQSVRDLLRPLLKQWLDENLPSIVERLVRAEIERVARGRA